MSDAPVVRKGPCTACPYRKDVASGVWAENEYDKLRRYDEETPWQPPNLFMCHATPEALCHGWAVVHSSRGLEFDLLALRIMCSKYETEVDIPEPAVPLFASGNEAANHGQADIEHPSPKAIKTVEKLQRKHERLR